MGSTETQAEAAAPPTLEGRLEQLRTILRECGSVCIGYSGGVDSVFLAWVALDTLGAECVLAVTGRSPAYPAAQHEIALDCVVRFDIPHLEIDTDELQDPNYAANPSNRCYYCKSELWPKLGAVARARGLRTVLDGSNADDAHDYRPGFLAARENGVRSPLLEAGLTKEDIRTISRAVGLPTWDQPASPCLSSRLPYGVAVTPLRLRQVEDAERILRETGFSEFRVRHHDDCLRLEFAHAELAKAVAEAAALHTLLRPVGMERVLFDVEGYRRGALNEVLVQIQPPTARPPSLPPHDAAGLHHDICVLHDVSVASASALADDIRRSGFRYVAIDLRHVAAVD